MLRPRWSTGQGVGWLVMAALFGLLARAHPTPAADFACAAGDVACLISAVNTANATGEADTITLAAGTYTLTRVDHTTEDGANGLPSILGVLTLQGAGPAATRLERAATAPDFRLLRVAAGGQLRVAGLTLAGGSVYGGGGLANLGGTVELTNCQLVGNSGPALWNVQGTAVIATSLVAENVAPLSRGGGVANTEGVVTIMHSTLARNLGTGGGGLYSEQGTVTLVNSTLVSNNGNIVKGTGGGVFIIGGTASIINTTIAGNEALGGGGVAIGSLAFPTEAAIVVLTNSTVVGNTVGIGDGGGLATVIGTVGLHSTLLARNASGPNPTPDCVGPVTSLGHNLIGDPTGCAIALLPTDLTGEPGLSPFSDDGTPGHGYFPLLPTSPAIDAGKDAACPPADQLGQPRVGPCDIGAVEFLPEQVIIRRAVFADPLALLVVSATSSAAPHAELFVTVPGCLAQAPMPRRGDLYLLLQPVATCGPLNGQTVTVTSTYGGSASGPLR